MKYFNLLLLFFVLQNPFSGFTQLPNANHHLTEKGGNSNNGIYFLLKESFPKNKKGQLFLNKKWQKGIVTDYQNNQFNIPVRFRVYQEEMQVQHIGKTKALQAQQVKKIEFDNRIFIASNFLINGENFMSFFEVINNGKLQLLSQYETVEKNGICNIKSIFYSKKGKNPAEKITLKKKYILELMRDYKSEIQSFMKKEKINLKESNDVIKLFKYYNSL